MPAVTGSVTDPDFRHRRAKHAAEARTTVDAHIRALVDRAPEITPAQRDKLATLLRPNGEAAQT